MHPVIVKEDQGKVAMASNIAAKGFILLTRWSAFSLKSACVVWVANIKKKPDWLVMLR